MTLAKMINHSFKDASDHNLKNNKALLISKWTFTLMQYMAVDSTETHREGGSERD